MTSRPHQRDNKSMRNSSLIFFFSIFALSFLVFPIQSFAQNQSPVKYISSEDQSLTISSIVVAPALDNMNNVFGEPLTKHLQEKIQTDQQWKLLDYPKELISLSEQLDSSDKNRWTLQEKTKTSALLTYKILKSPKGISLIARLYVGLQLQPLMQESVDQLQTFNLDELKKQTDILYDRIKNNLPYQALILSRRGSQVTLNIGTKNGLPKSMEVRAVLILKVQRHPKLRTMISAEKEILGKIEITKADDYLSFGEIQFEKQPNLILVGTKIVLDPSVPATAAAVPDASLNSSDALPYGEKPQEWVPMNPPQFGSVAVALGFVQYNQNMTLTTAGSLTATNNFGPTIRLLGELWINDRWFANLQIRQSAFAVSNSLPGSTPSSLNMSLSNMMLSGGYNFLLTEDFFGPKIKLTLGMTKFEARSDQSTPLAITNMSYGGLALGVAGSFPVSEIMPLELGAQFKYYTGPSTNESVASGAVTTTKINDFGIFGKYRRSQNFYYTADFQTEYYSTDFDIAGAVRPDPASGISHKVTNFLVGIEYLF